ncbi:MAG TPA: metallophosphoesterase [Acidobacteriaceae bacterium]|nr:metallophosphoesterase [Acidobacteriaceae bacterium]
MNRRNFLKGTGLAAAGCALGNAQARAPKMGPRVEFSTGSFTFAFFTDVHIEPEMDAPQGTELAMEVINASDAEFAICGGDHVFDALKAHRDRILYQYELYAEAEKTLRMPVWHVLGNHDVAGLETGMSHHDPIFGKALFQKVFNTPTYYSFQHKGVNFIMLDSIMIKGHDWQPAIDIPQAAWLERVLQATRGTPSIVISHVPLATSMASYGPGSNNKIYQPVLNANYIIPMLEYYDVIAVLQGHTHISETVHRMGIHYVTGGAVCGNWWKGAQYGDREGVTFVTVDNGSITTNYVPTRFLTLEQS